MKTVTYEEVAGVVRGIIEGRGFVLDDIEFIIGISRGGLFPAMVVATTLVRPLIVAYIDKQDNVYFDRAEWIENKKILLVDDIVRTGRTMGKIKELLLRSGSLSVLTLTPYYLTAAQLHAPDYGSPSAEDVAFPWDK